MCVFYNSDYTVQREDKLAKISDKKQVFTLESII